MRTIGEDEAGKLARGPKAGVLSSGSVSGTRNVMGRGRPLARWRPSPTRSERTRVCTAAIALAMIKTQRESVSERKTEDVRNAQLL